MLKLKLITSTILLASSISYAQTARIKGNIPGLPDGTATFHYHQDTVRLTDTIQIKDGKFNLSVTIPEPQKVFIMFPERYKEFFVEGGDISITGSADLQTFEVKGSKIQDEATAYNHSLEDIFKQEKELYSKYGKVSKEEQIALEAKLKELRYEKRDRAKQYITKHPSSAFSVSLVSDRSAMGEYNDVKSIYDLLSPAAQKTGEAKLIAQRLAILKRSNIGEHIIDFVQNDTSGVPVKYNNFKGKYVFIDFWASWCGPCRAENPNVLKAYNAFKDKNFTVVGISLDDNGERWKKAIVEDKMPWTQLSDLQGWKNELSTYYGIQGIPSSLLISPEGKIIAKDLRGTELHLKLEEILK